MKSSRNGKSTSGNSSNSYCTAFRKTHPTTHPGNSLQRQVANQLSPKSDSLITEAQRSFPEIQQMVQLLHISEVWINQFKFLFSTFTEALKNMIKISK